MSGDTHVRKRGADKRRKKVEEVVEEPVPLLIPASEENIHVHKDAHLGGNFCSKIVFFCLFGTLAVLVGLLIIEFQGSGDVESATDSPWSVMLEGWVDDQLDAHDHEEHSSLADHSGEEEEESENEVEFSIYGVSEPEEEEQSHENEDEEEDPAVNDDKEIEANEQENFGFYKSLYASIYSTKDDDSEKGDEGEDGSPEDSDKNVEGDDDDGNAEDDEDKNEEDDDDGSAEDDNNDDNLNNDNDDEEEEVGSEQEDAGDIFGEKNDDDYFGSNNDVDADDPKEDSGENNEDEETESEKNHNFFKKTDSRGSNDEIEDDNNDDDVDDELIQRILTKSHEKKHRFENIREKAYETGAEENIRKVMNGLRKKKLEEDVSQEIVDEEPLEGVEEKVTSEENVEEEKEEAAQEQVIDDDDNEETVGVILKFGVGVALIVVAHVVLIKKWNSWDSGSSADINQTADNKEDLPDEVPVTDRRESLVDENATLPAPSGSEDEVEDESQHTGDTTPEESDEEPATERYSSKAYAQLSETPPESEGEESNVGSSDGEREVDVSTQRWETNFSNEEVEAETGTEEEETEDEEEEEENEPSEDEEPPPPPPRPEPTYTRRRGGPRSSDVEFEEEYYQYSDVSNEYDWAIRNELDFAEDEFLNGSLENSKLLFSEILTKHPNSVRASYGVAKCFDQMAENLKSNTHLLQAIDAYTRALEMPNVTDILYLQMVNRTIERMRFKGLYEKLILLHGNVVRRFPNEPTHRTQMAITFLLMNRLNDAKTVLENVLNRWPEDGAAAAHYGFILKLENNLVEGVKYLKAGLDSNHSGAQDSRFYFHLGDALLRLGRKDEALQIHENGVSKGMFRSVYQRSLYNVDRLSAQPWWTLGETTYQKFFRKLEENWKMIRKEALAVIKKQTEFQDEAENLRDAGDWKQFELFARGRKNTGNCQKVPVTCGIVSIFEPASSCTRGQVKFSAMMPGTHVWPHCGPTNCRLRAHLGLVVPPETYLRVANETRSWKEGEVLIFDDSFEHEVWHNGTSLRLVLIVDTWHPELSSQEKKSLPPI